MFCERILIVNCKSTLRTLSDERFLTPLPFYLSFLLSFFLLQQNKLQSLIIYLAASQQVSPPPSVSVHQSSNTSAGLPRVLTLLDIEHFIFIQHLLKHCRSDDQFIVTLTVLKCNIVRTSTYRCRRTGRVRIGERTSMKLLVHRLLSNTLNSQPRAHPEHIQSTCSEINSCPCTQRQHRQ